jgi:hypothetical protein
MAAAALTTRKRHRSEMKRSQTGVPTREFAYVFVEVDGYEQPGAPGYYRWREAAIACVYRPGEKTTEKTLLWSMKFADSKWQRRLSETPALVQHRDFSLGLPINIQKDSANEQHRALGFSAAAMKHVVREIQNFRILIGMNVPVVVVADHPASVPALEGERYTQNRSRSDDDRIVWHTINLRKPLLVSWPSSGSLLRFEERRNGVDSIRNCREHSSTENVTACAARTVQLHREWWDDVGLSFEYMARAKFPVDLNHRIAGTCMSIWCLILEFCVGSYEPLSSPFASL